MIILLSVCTPILISVTDDVAGDAGELVFVYCTKVPLIHNWTPSSSTFTPICTHVCSGILDFVSSNN